MSTLGIGTRVFVGWCPDDQLALELIFDGRLKRGAIIGGPFLPGVRLRDSVNGDRVHIPAGHVRWNVMLDCGKGASFDESMLTPIDDGDQTIEAPQEEELTA